jgi:hypothetical protein
MATRAGRGWPRDPRRGRDSAVSLEDCPVLDEMSYRCPSVVRQLSRGVWRWSALARLCVQRRRGGCTGRARAVRLRLAGARPGVASVTEPRPEPLTLLIKALGLTETILAETCGGPDRRVLRRVLRQPHGAVAVLTAVVRDRGQGPERRSTNRAVVPTTRRSSTARWGASPFPAQAKGSRRRGRRSHVLDLVAMTENTTSAQLPPTLSIVQQWVRAMWHDQDTPAAAALMHPAALDRWLPRDSDVGAALRDSLPWLGDNDVWSGEPKASEAGPDLDLVTVGIGDVALLRILVLRKSQPATDGPERRLIFRVVESPPA